MYNNFPSGMLKCLLICTLLGTGCSHSFSLPPNLLDKSVDISSPQLAPFKSMYGVPRKKMGLAPLPKHARVTINLLTGPSAVSSGYDAMLQMPERSVVFQKVKNTYRWIGESESYQGPNPYPLPDGSSAHESIYLSYSIRPYLGADPQLNTLHVIYQGSDPQLSNNDNLTLKDVLPLLKKWRKY
ncbi:MAG: hypothetical protein ACRYFS_14770 [Janthinobacterium lividum]